MGHKAQGTAGLYTHLFRESYEKVEAVLEMVYGPWMDRDPEDNGAPCGRGGIEAEQGAPFAASDGPLHRLTAHIAGAGDCDLVRACGYGPCDVAVVSPVARRARRYPVWGCGAGSGAGVDSTPEKLDGTSPTRSESSTTWNGQRVRAPP